MAFSYNPDREFSVAVTGPVTIHVTGQADWGEWQYVVIDLGSWTEGICAEYFDWLAGIFRRLGIDRRYHQVVWGDDRENNQLYVRWRDREFDTQE